MYSLLLPSGRRSAEKGAHEPGDSGFAVSTSAVGEPGAVSQLSSECLLSFKAGRSARAWGLSATRFGGDAASTVPNTAVS